jgi:N-acetylmuramic acid 6-phosphate etherase
MNLASTSGPFPSVPPDEAEQLDGLLTEAIHPQSQLLDLLSPLEFVYLMLQEEAHVPEAVARQAPRIARAIQIVAEALRHGGRLIYVGAGTSGRLGILDAAECPPTFGTPPELVVGVIAGGPGAVFRAVEGAEDRWEAAWQDLQPLHLHRPDVLVGIATSGRTPYVMGALRYGRECGCFTIGLACNEDAAQSSECDLLITPIVGPEVLSGSTRLKAGTATKLILNLLSTGALIQLGKVYRNLMVDLRATNSKLRRRAVRIVRQLLGLTEEQSLALLTQCQWEVKTALVAGRLGCSPDRARQRLGEAGGQVRAAIEPPAALEGPDATAPPGPILVVLEGGGTKTRAAAVVFEPKTGQAKILAVGESGGSNPYLVGVPKVQQQIAQALGAVQRAVPFRGKALLLMACLAGAGSEADRSLWKRWFEELHAAEGVEVLSDADAVFAATCPEGWGQILIAGTGSVAWARDPEGRERRAGGWGWLLGDPGSAVWLAQQALRAAARTVDAGDELSPAQQELLRAIAQKAESPRGTFRLLLSQPFPETVTSLGRVAQTISKLAEEGNAEAVGWLKAAAAELATLVSETAQLLQPILVSGRAVPLGLCGGLLAGSPLLRAELFERLKDHGFHFEPVRVVRNALEGAILLAAQRCAPFMS